jgi:hypothetical protein
VSYDPTSRERARAIAIAHPPSALSASLQTRLRLVAALAIIVQLALTALPTL